MVAPREATPIIRLFRNIISGRKLKNALRFQDSLSARTQPPPNLPEGPSHKIAFNYYYTRDGRRESRPPVVVAESTKGKIRLLEAGSPSGATIEKKFQYPLPGKEYQWTLSKDK